LSHGFLSVQDTLYVIGLLSKKHCNAALVPTA